MKAVIVNADDFGESKGINAGIVRAHREGIVTSASILATGAAFEDACTCASQNPALGIGMHLAWVDGRPILPASAIRSLTDAGERFWPSWSVFFSRAVMGKINLDELEREGSAQIERALAAGLRPDHINSHEHIHMWKPAFDRVVRLARRFGIPAVRVTSESSVDIAGDLVRPAGVLRRAALNAAGRMAAASDGVWRSSACIGLADSRRLTAPRLIRLLRSVPRGISEFMCHPGDGEGADRFRSAELRALISSGAREALERAGADRITFAEAVARTRLSV